jgi:IS30 family transposase
MSRNSNAALPKELYRLLTWDRRKELAAHRRFTVATDIQVYFCDPHRPWQRGSNENTMDCYGSTYPKGSIYRVSRSFGSTRSPAD